MNAHNNNPGPKDQKSVKAPNGLLLSRVQKITGAIETVAGVHVGFLDPSGTPSRFSSDGALHPAPDDKPMFSPGILQAMLRIPRPVLHVGPEQCAAASVPFLTDGRLAGFITAWGFCLPEPDEDWTSALKQRFAVEGWREIFGERDKSIAISFEKFLALVDLLEGATAQITLLGTRASIPHAAENDTAPLSWAVALALEDLATDAASSGELSEAVHARERLEALYDSTQDAMLMLDSDLKIVSVNKELGRIFGTEPDAFVGVTGEWLRRWVVRNSREPQKVEKTIAGLLDNPSAVLDDEIELVSPRDMILRVYSAPVKDKESKVIGRVLMFRDITAFRQARRELIGNEKMGAMNRAAAGLAHELNNIFAGVVTYADYALEEGKSEKIREALRMSIAAAEKASGIVGEFLSVFGPSDTVRQDVDLHVEMERLLDSLEGDFRKENIRIHRFLEAVPQVNVDPVQVLQVLHHLLINAKQAVGKDGTITVRAEVDWDRGFVRIVISDSGPGIPPELVDRIFDPFFTTKGVVSGGDTAARGLGLSIAKGIIDAHGGKIYAGNVMPHGASFVVELPLPGAAAEEAPDASLY